MQFYWVNIRQPLLLKLNAHTSRVFWSTVRIALFGLREAGHADSPKSPDMS